MIKNIIKKILGPSNIFYLKSFFPTLAEIELQKRKIKFYSEFIKKDDLFFDVGANIGNRIEPILGLGARVVAIEPQEDCYKFLEMKYKNKIILVKKGAGEKIETKEFFSSEIHTIASFSEDWIEAVSKSGRFKRSNWKSKKLIEITTIDELIMEYGVPQFIKIDVEGYELEVLRGLSHSINYISFEYTVPEQINKAINCIEQIRNINNLIECNYSIGESLKFSLMNWISPNDMIDIISTDEFKNTRLGDIYIRRNIIE